MGRRKILLVSASAAAVLLLGGVAAAYWAVHRKAPDIHRLDAPFSSEPEPSAPPPSSSSGGGKHKRRHAEDFGPSWAVYGRNAARTRDASELTAIRPPFRVAWRSKRPLGLLEFPPSYHRGVLYLARDSGWVSAMEMKTRRLLWSRRIGPVPDQPAVDDKRLYLGSFDDHFYALDVRTGRTVWRASPGNKFESSPVLYRDLVITGSKDGRVSALEARTGRVRWSFRAAGSVKDSPAVSGGRVYFGAYGGRMYCLRASDGRQMWSTQTNGLASGFSAGNFYASPAVRYGRVYIGNTDGKIYSFVAATGEIAWTYSMPDWAYGSPGVADGRVFGTSFDGTVVALGARNGNLLWRHKLPTRTLASPTVIGPLVYVADLGPSRRSNGRLYAYDPASGRLRWTFRDGKYSTVIAAQNRLVVAGFTHLYILRPTGA